MDQMPYYETDWGNLGYKPTQQNIPENDIYKDIDGQIDYLNFYSNPENWNGTDIEKQEAAYKSRMDLINLKQKKEEMKYYDEYRKYNLEQKQQLIKQRQQKAVPIEQKYQDLSKETGIMQIGGKTYQFPKGEGIYQGNQPIPQPTIPIEGKPKSYAQQMKEQQINEDKFYWDKFGKLFQQANTIEALEDLNNKNNSGLFGTNNITKINKMLNDRYRKITVKSPTQKGLTQNQIINIKKTLLKGVPTGKFDIYGKQVYREPNKEEVRQRAEDLGVMDIYNQIEKYQPFINKWGALPESKKKDKVSELTQQIPQNRQNVEQKIIPSNQPPLEGFTPEELIAQRMLGGGTSAMTPPSVVNRMPERHVLEEPISTPKESAMNQFIEGGKTALTSPFIALGQTYKQQELPNVPIFNYEVEQVPTLTQKEGEQYGTVSTEPRLVYKQKEPVNLPSIAQITGQPLLNLGLAEHIIADSFEQVADALEGNPVKNIAEQSKKDILAGKEVDISAKYNEMKDALITKFGFNPLDAQNVLNPIGVIIKQHQPKILKDIEGFPEQFAVGSIPFFVNPAKKLEAEMIFAGLTPIAKKALSIVGGVYVKIANRLGTPKATEFIKQGLEKGLDPEIIATEGIFTKKMRPASVEKAFEIVNKQKDKEKIISLFEQPEMKVPRQTIIQPSIIEKGKEIKIKDSSYKIEEIKGDFVKATDLKTNQSSWFNKKNMEQDLEVGNFDKIDEAMKNLHGGVNPVQPLFDKVKAYFKPYKKTKPEIVKQSYDLEDIFWRDRDVDAVKTCSKGMVWQEAITNFTGSKNFGDKEKILDQAMSLRKQIGTSEKWMAFARKNWDKYTKEEQQVIKLSQLLPQELKMIVEDEAKYTLNTGLRAKEAGVLPRLKENYVMTTYVPKEEYKYKWSEPKNKFAVDIQRAKEKKFDNDLIAWANGYEPRIKGLTNRAMTANVEETDAIAYGNFINALTKPLEKDADAVLYTQPYKKLTLPNGKTKVIPLEGYRKVNIPSFFKWQEVKKVGEKAKNKTGEDWKILDGILYKKRELYAPEEIAHHFENIFGVSKLKGLPVVKQVDEINAALKKTILSVSYFHHGSFLRNLLLGTKATNPWKFAEKGVDLLRQNDPVVELLVGNGTTIGKVAEWDEAAATEVGKQLKALSEKAGIPNIYKSISDLSARHQFNLFQRLGVGLKLSTGKLLLERYMKQYPERDINEIAKEVSVMVNNEYGGIHLGRAGRNPTIQHLMHIAMLAPDWTETNFKIVLNAISSGHNTPKGSPEALKAELAKRFLGRAFVTSTLLSGAINLILHRERVGKVYEGMFFDNGRLSWKKFKKMRWFGGVDITPVFQFLAELPVVGDLITDREEIKKQKKYFNLAGQIKDPLKYIIAPESLQGKASPILGTIFDWIKGTNWQGKSYTSIQKLLEEGKTSKYEHIHKGGVGWSKLPSFSLEQSYELMPIPLKALMGFSLGEARGLDALATLGGQHLETEYIEPSQSDKNEDKQSVLNAFYKEYKGQNWTVDTKFMGLPIQTGEGKTIKETPKEIKQWYEKKYGERITNSDIEEYILSKEGRLPEEPPQPKSEITKISSDIRRMIKLKELSKNEEDRKRINNKIQTELMQDLYKTISKTNVNPDNAKKISRILRDLYKNGNITEDEYDEILSDWENKDLTNP